MLDLNNTSQFTQLLSKTQGCVFHDLYPKSYLKGQGYIEHTQTQYPDHNSSLSSCLIWTIFYIVIVHYPMTGVS